MYRIFVSDRMGTCVFGQTGNRYNKLSPEMDTGYCYIVKLYAGT